LEPFSPEDPVLTTWLDQVKMALKREADPGLLAGALQVCPNPLIPREIVILLPNNQRQHRTLHIQKDVLPYALC